MKCRRPEPATVPALAAEAASGRRRFSRTAPAAITPRARKTAARLGVDPDRIQGTGRNGRSRERDMLVFAEKKPQLAARSRQALAERLRQSKDNTIAVTLMATADATNLVNLRQQFKAGDHEMVPTVTDLFVRLVARCLQQHPHLNARWQENQLVIRSDIHIGIAVDAGQELLVAVLRDVARKSVREIARQARNLIDQARSHRLRAADMEGGTFTISNLGALGVDSFTPVINWPEIAILGIGRIRQQPLVVEGMIIARE